MGVIQEKQISIKGSKYNVMLEQYESAFDVVEDCQTRIVHDSKFDRMETEVEKRRNFNFYGVHSYKEALELFRNGYVDKVKEISKSVNKSTHGINKRISIYNDITGFSPIVPLAILGVPNSMINSKMKPMKTKVLDIYYDMTCSCEVDQDDILKAGVSLLEVLSKLEMQGYRINLHATQTYTDNSIINILSIKIKNANQPLDLKRISFPLIHTAFFRVIGFDWYSKCPKSKYLSGYGRNVRQQFGFSNEKMTEFVNQVFGENKIYISASNLIGESKEEQQKIIIGVIENGTKNKINNT